MNDLKVWGLNSTMDMTPFGKKENLGKGGRL
jgi:hypothetical protein